MIITVPTAHMRIESQPGDLVRVEQNEPLPWVIFDQIEFENNVVYVDFARGPPQKKSQTG